MGPDRSEPMSLGFPAQVEKTRVRGTTGQVLCDGQIAN